MIVRRGLVAAHFVAPHLRPLTPLLPRRRSDPRLCSSYSSPSLRITASGDMAETRSPPVAKKVEHVMQMFGDVRVDNYYWLRDDSRCNPDMLSYLREENDYTGSVMSGELVSLLGIRVFRVFGLGILIVRIWVDVKIHFGSKLTRGLINNIWIFLNIILKNLS